MSKLKKFLTTGILGLGVLVGVASPAFADTAGWQAKTPDYIKFDRGTYDDMWETYSKNGAVHNYSGNFKYTTPIMKDVSSIYGAMLSVAVMEYDPDNPDDQITCGATYPSDYNGDFIYSLDEICDIRPWQDGENNQAEIYLKYYYNFSTSTSHPFYLYD